MSKDILNFDYLANESFNLDALKYYSSLSTSVFNKNSNHRLGFNANKYYNEAHCTVLKCFNGYNYVEFIPGGASMANKHSILGCIPSKPKMIDGIRKDVVLISSIEHTSIINYIIPILLDNDYTVMMIQCENNGTISINSLENLILCYEKRIALVSIMNVNNDTGIIQNLSQYISKVKCYSSNIIFHSDITQGLSIFWNEDTEYKPDIITFSGYKLGGPHFGVVVSKHKLNGDYTGTPDVASMYTLSMIIDNKYKKLKTNTIKNKELKQYIVNAIVQWLDNNCIKYNIMSLMNNSLDNVISILLYGYQGKIIQQMLSEENICIGTGSACQSVKQSGSHVIKAMGYSTEITFNLIRISWGEIINISDIVSQNYDKNLEYATLLINKFCETVGKIKPLISLPKSILSTMKLKQIFEPIIKKNDALDKFGKNLILNDFDSIKNILARRLKLSTSETYLKGDNKFRFINDLKSDILHRIPNKKIWNIIETNGSIILALKDQDQKDDNQNDIIYQTMHILKYVPGIALIISQYSITSHNDQDTLNNLMKLVMYLYNISRRRNESICIRTSITAKNFLIYKSQELNIILGQLLVEKFKAPVNLKKPDIEFHIDIISNRIDVSIERLTGMVGLPLGSEGTVAVILTNKNSLRSLTASVQLSTRGSKIVCYSYIEIKEFNNIISKINPYITYKFINADDNIKQLLATITENIIIYEINTNNMITHLSYMKDLGKIYNKYITTVTSHMSFDDIIKYLVYIGLDYFRPLYDDELIENINDIHTSGVMSLISGGIDSPVSTDLIYQYCKSKKLPTKLIHFSSNIDKIEVVKKIRDKIDNKLELFIIDFSRLQDEITNVCPEKYRTILYKVFMVLISNKISEIEHLSCIVMGNSWGQVASQTCENLYITDKFSNLPIYNPLLGLAKTQIILKARDIDTYSDSICTGTNDCCVMYLSKHPILKADAAVINTYIDKFNNFMTLITVIKI